MESLGTQIHQKMLSLTRDQLEFLKEKYENASCEETRKLYYETWVKMWEIDVKHFNKWDWDLSAIEDLCPTED